MARTFRNRQHNQRHGQRLKHQGLKQERLRQQRLRQQGSALMLVPVGILVLVILGSIAVDSAIAFMAHRELLNRATAAANDAATVGIPGDQLQHDQDAYLDPDRISSIVQQRISITGDDGITLTKVTSASERRSVNGKPVNVVTVTVEGDVDYIFAKAVPGAPHKAHVRATAESELRFRQL